MTNTILYKWSRQLFKSVLIQRKKKHWLLKYDNTPTYNSGYINLANYA